MKKIVYAVLAIILIAFIAGGTFILMAPDIPADTDTIIAQAKSMDLPEYYQGQEAYAMNGDIKLWYEVNPAIGDKKGTVLLIMGYTSTSIQWPKHFYGPLQAAGYDVIRFDHRDIGKSTWLSDWDADQPYTLTDIAADCEVILDAAQVDQAHIIGISMGGMIAQTFAIEYPDRILSLTSMSSTGYFDDESLAGIWPETERAIGRYTIKYMINDGPDTPYKFSLTASNLFKGEYESDNINTVLKVRYELERRAGINPDAAKHHEVAIKASGSRYDALQQLDVPTLVIHGRSDPLVNFAHGEKTAELIPNAKTLYIDDLGHDIPKQYAEQMTGAIIGLMDSTNPLIATSYDLVLDGE